MKQPYFYDPQSDMLFRPAPEPIRELPLGVRSVGHYRVPLGWRSVPNKKSFTQLYWGLDGASRAAFPAGSALIEPEYVFIYRPGERHDIRAELGDWNFRFATLDGTLMPEIIASFNLPHKPWKAGPCPEDLFVKLDIQIRDASPGGQRAASATAYRLLCTLAGEPASSAHPDALVREAIGIMQRDFNRPDLNIEALARNLDVHRSTLNRRFRRHMRQSVGSYLAELRLQQALGLLKDTRHPLTEIAARSGYSDPDYFCRVIKKATGKSPGAHRHL